MKIKIGSRTSRLALWQSNHVIERLQSAWSELACQIEPFVTKGDKTLDKPLPQIGGKGLFTAELEQALCQGVIDIAVHSLKDLPVEDAPGLMLGAIISRAPVLDGLVARNNWTLATLPPGAVVGTSSNRRRAQLLAVRPDLVVKSIRGNVETRINKVIEGRYDATVLAAAGLQRLSLTHVVTEWLPLPVMLPAPGQGALAVQCRANDAVTLSLLSAIDDGDVRMAVTAERTFLNAMGGGCLAPIAAYAEIKRRDAEDAEGLIYLEVLVASIDGKQIIRLNGCGNDPIEISQRLANEAFSQGAESILADLATASLQSPLKGKRILITRSRQQAGSVADKLAQSGAEPIILPVIEFEPLPTDELDAALAQIEKYDWLVFTSGNAVDFFFSRVSDSGPAVDLISNPQSPVFSLPPIAASGSATAVKLAELGVDVDVIPDEFIGEKLVEGLGHLTSRRVLLPRAKIGRPQIAELLRAQGAEVDDIPLYDTVTAVPDPEALAQLEQGVDVITFTSPSSVRNFLQILNEAKNQTLTQSLTSESPPIIACIGPITAEQAQKSGLSVQVMPTAYTIDGLLQAIENYFSEVKNQIQ